MGNSHHHNISTCESERPATIVKNSHHGGYNSLHGHLKLSSFIFLVITGPSARRVLPLKEQGFSTGATAPPPGEAAAGSVCTATSVPEV